MDDQVVREAAQVLEPVPGSARAARELVRTVLREGQRPEWVEGAELAISELVTNAVLHAHTPVDVRIVLSTTTLRVEVRDESPVMPIARDWGIHASTGRGIALVAALSTAYGVKPLVAGGKVVWFALQDPVSGLHGDVPLTRDTVAELTVRDGRDVVLYRFPPGLWLAAREHHDAILRDFALYRVSHLEGVTASGEDFAKADLARLSLSAALDEAIAALPAAPVAVDLCLRVRPDSFSHFATLQDVLDEAETLARSGQLLVRPALPEVVGLRDWACEQVVAQGWGVEPVPWHGAAATRYIQQDVPTPCLAWDPTLLEHPEALWVVADDANRIVAISAELAETLGWTEATLCGRRLVTLIPPRFREAHVGGFTRHLATGTSTLIGSTVEVPVLRADGGEHPVRLSLAEHAAPEGRTVFIAYINGLDRGQRAPAADPTGDGEAGR